VPSVPVLGCTDVLVGVTTVVGGLVTTVVGGLVTTVVGGLVVWPVLGDVLSNRVLGPIVLSESGSAWEHAANNTDNTRRQVTAARLGARLTAESL
jgi:UPF0716 family protein affecting phage T7 exclusion